MDQTSKLVDPVSILQHSNQKKGLWKKIPLSRLHLRPNEVDYSMLISIPCKQLESRYLLSNVALCGYTREGVTLGKVPKPKVRLSRSSIFVIFIFGAMLKTFVSAAEMHSHLIEWLSIVVIVFIL